jgi:quercetin dioxygenase-like cupin family protein
MVTRRVFLENGAGLMLTLPLQAAAGQGAQGPRVVFEHVLPDLTMKGWAVTAVEVAYAPGESTPSHRHPGITLAYVLEGEIRSKVGDEPEKTYSAGQMFIETPGQLHGVSANASQTRPARLLALLLAEKGQALTTPAGGRP